MYGLYISDVLQQVNEVMTLFAMEKELRIIQNRGHFPIPTTIPQGTKIESSKDIDKVLETVDREVVEMITAVRESELDYEKEKADAKNKEQQVRPARQTNKPDFNFLTVNSSTPIRNTNTGPQTRTNHHQHTETDVHFDPNPVHHLYPMTDPTSHNDWYEPPANDSIIQGAGSAPGGQFVTNTTNVTGCNKPWRYNNGTNTATRTNYQTYMTRPSSHNDFHNNLPNSSDNRNGPTCFRCGEQGHMRLECRTERVYCTHCRSPNHDTKACRKHHNNTPSPTNSHIPIGYHPTATPPPLLGAAAATGTHPQQTGTNTNRPLFQNYLDTQQPRTGTTIHTPFNGASPAPSANMTEALTQIMTQVANNNKKDDITKQMMKNIKIFDSTNKAECITWLSQIEAAARFSNSSFHELICQSMAPSMLHILAELSALATDQDIKEVILAHYSDIPSTTEAAARLQGMQISPTEPLVTFNSRYEAIHRVAFSLSPSEQYNKTIIIEYAKKLPQNARDKLLRKIVKKDSYIRTLDDAFKQAIEINRETSFVEAEAGKYTTGKYNKLNCTKIDTQINALDDSFQDCDINAMNTRSTNRSGDGSLNGFFNRSSSRNSSHN